MISNSADLPKAANEKEWKRNTGTVSKQNSEQNNPCLKEQKLSYKCLEKNDYDQKACITAFTNYTACREFWHKVGADRRRNGIRPHLPPVEEREKMKAEYMAKFHGS